MLKIPKPIIKYRILPNDSIQLSNVKNFDGTRITCILRQAIPDDLTSIDSWQKDPKITPKEVDERTLAKLITKWGDRESLTSLEVAQIPIESRGVLLEVFKSFCMPTAELVEDTDEEGATENILSAQ
ncbi:MAG: hypothetical protein AAFR83_00200 [Cyanobacteria bacterium J06629_18]